MKKLLKFLVVSILFVFTLSCFADSTLSLEEKKYISLYDEAITSLSKGEVPVYEIGRVDKKNLYRAFLYVFKIGAIDSIEKRIAFESERSFRMVRVFDPKKFGFAFWRETRARYYFLIGGGEARRVVIGPSIANKPVMFLPSKK